MAEAHQRFPPAVKPGPNHTWNVWVAISNARSRLESARIDTKNEARSIADSIAKRENNPGIVEWTSDKRFQKFDPILSWWENERWTGHLRAPLIVKGGLVKPEDGWGVWAGRSSIQSKHQTKKPAVEEAMSEVTRQNRPAVIILNRNDGIHRFESNVEFWEGAWDEGGRGTLSPNGEFGF